MITTLLSSACKCFSNNIGATISEDIADTIAVLSFVDPVWKSRIRDKVDFRILQH